MNEKLKMKTCVGRAGNAILQKYSTITEEKALSKRHSAILIPSTIGV